MLFTLTLTSTNKLDWVKPQFSEVASPVFIVNSTFGLNSTKFILIVVLVASIALVARQVRNFVFDVNSSGDGSFILAPLTKYSMVALGLALALQSST